MNESDLHKWTISVEFQWLSKKKEETNKKVLNFHSIYIYIAKNQMN